MSSTTIALFMIATMAVILPLVGIHNSWDTVTFIVVGDIKAAEKEKSETT